MATITIDVSELAGRLPTLPDWTRPGDVVVVTRDGRAICHLLPVADEEPTPAHVGAPARRPVGERATGGVWIPDNFNDPAAWADSITDARGRP